jgi:hypothetical protein
LGIREFGRQVHLQDPSVHPLKKGWVGIQKIYINISVRCVIKKFPKISLNIIFEGYRSWVRLPLLDQSLESSDVGNELFATLLPMQGR